MSVSYFREHFGFFTFSWKGTNKFVYVCIKEKAFLLDAPIAQSGLFGNVVYAARELMAFASGSRS